MKIFRNITYLCCLLAMLFSFHSCKDDAVIEAQKNGYLQLLLEKEQISRGMTGGSMLGQLADAKKIEITLLYENNEIRQTLNIHTASGEAAEFAVRTEKLELRPGTYTLTGYKIYGSKVIDGQAEVLQVGSPDETTRIEIKSNMLHLETLHLNVQLRGKVSFMLEKDFSQIPNKPEGISKSGTQDEAFFNYYDVEFVEMHIQTAYGVRVDTLETRYVKGDECWSTDTLTLNAGNYTVKRMLLMNKYHTVVLVQDPAHKFTVAEAQMKREACKVVYPANALAIQDYIALYNIWVKMKGETWYNVDDNAPVGSNWVFEGRQLDDWGIQPNVNLHGNGRVQVLNLGAFNAKGMVPDEIGQLTALEALYLGSHSDNAVDDDDKIERIDMYSLVREGVDIRANRMAIGKERLALRHRKTNPTDFEKTYANKPALKYAKTYATILGQYTNSITGISPEIRKCKSLNSLFIANGMVDELPEEISELENLTDVEIYNCPNMSKFPKCFSKMANLVALNFSGMPKMDPESAFEGLSELFASATNKNLQILYLNDLNLKEMPRNMEKLTRLGLLDLADNKIKSLYPLTNDVAPVQVFFDNNLIESVPDDFCNIDDIESFSVAFNRIKIFPNTFNKNKTVFKAKSVDFSDNQIETFSSTFEGVDVESLNLNGNKFGKANTLNGKGTFPTNLAETNSLVSHLQLANNYLDTLSFQSIKGLSSLIAFDLKGNSLKYMPIELHTGNFPWITGLDLSFNNFEVFPVNVLNLSTLLQLIIPGQIDSNGKRTLKDWPMNLWKHYTLRVLDISGNDIRRVDDYFPDLLNVLFLDDNPNISITLSEAACQKILGGGLKFAYDLDQDIQGCPQIMK